MFIDDTHTWWWLLDFLLDLLAVMPLTKFFLGAAGVAASAVVICNIAPWLVAKPQLATLDYLAAAKLQTLDGQKRNFTANELWQKNGAVIMAVRRPG